MSAKVEQGQLLIEVEDTKQAVPPLAVAPVGTEPGQLLALAVEKNLDIEKLERLMELQERWQKAQAKRAYVAALAKFQSVVPRLPKNKRVFFETDRGKTEYFYTPLSDIDEIIRPFMLECGLCKKWNILDTPEGISVTCLISHIDGHTEAGDPMTAPPDDSGKKNKIQARGSTVQYLQRYTLIASLGLTSADSDIDGRLPMTGTGDAITEKQIADLKALMDEVKVNVPKFLEFMKVDAVADIRTGDYKKAIAALEKKRK